MTVIVPSITSIFADMNQALPAPTLFLIRVSEFFKSYWWMLLFLIAGLILSIRLIRKTTKGRHFLDKTTLLLPIVGPLAKKLAVNRLARTLGSLLENGVTMLSALEIVKNIAGNVLIAEAVEQASIGVGKGQGLGNALWESGIFPNLSIQMIQVGDKAGNWKRC
jgi:general secretion pathway protein F